MIQKSSFSDGGFVLHRITGLSKAGSRVSAWYDASAALVDAEIIGDGRNSSVTHDGPIWRRLQEIGAVWAGK